MFDKSNNKNKTSNPGWLGIFCSRIAEAFILLLMFVAVLLFLCLKTHGSSSDSIIKVTDTVRVMNVNSYKYQDSIK